MRRIEEEVAKEQAHQEAGASEAKEGGNNDDQN
jgi:hypothetical protein